MSTQTPVSMGTFPPDYHLAEELTISRLLFLAQQVIDFETVFLAGLTEEAMNVLESLHVPLATDHCSLEAPTQVPLEQTYCQFVYRSGKPLVVADAQHTLPFATMTITRDSDIGAYVGVPLIGRDGTIFGTLCGLHPEPKTLTTNQVMLLQVVGRSLMTLIEREVLVAQLQADVALAMRSIDEASGLPDRLAFECSLQDLIIQAATTSRPLSVVMVQPASGALKDASQALARQTPQVFAYADGIIALLLPALLPNDAASWAATTLPNGAHAGIATYPTIAPSQQLLVDRALAALAGSFASSTASPVCLWTPMLHHDATFAGPMIEMGE